ncbi:MAG: hypothetical protein IJL02_04600 [Methanobrevibacter sp.]|uniref:hypothetical protein n=1 Tax=Methanobrevibacter sp. TaxID=66852 RepID=UPI0025D12758|nr:hypothetical protein [Methanobrevibacter sp.]MBQ6099124.1 hypothetical protein [Methanobrevibacter sp.]
MTNTLLDEFKKYEMLKNKEIKLEKSRVLSPTLALPLICSELAEIDNFDSVLIIENKNPNEDFEEKLFSILNVPKYNKNLLFFVLHELRNNIYDHSEFSKGFVMGKSYSKYSEVGFIDNGITIPNCLKHADYSFENDCDAILKAINGLSTKKEVGFVERGTGLNNTINIVRNGCSGCILIASGNGLISIDSENIHMRDISKNPLKGTLVSLKMDLTKKVDIYNYLNPIKL